MFNSVVHKGAKLNYHLGVEAQDHYLILIMIILVMIMTVMIVIIIIIIITNRMVLL